MEKLKLNNNMTFPLIVNGVDDFTKDQLILKFTPESRGLEEIEKFFVPENTQRIEILSEADELLRPFTGYTVLNSIMLQKNQFIGYSVATTEVTGEEPIESPEIPVEIWCDVVTVVLLKTDLRTEINNLKNGQSIQDDAILELADMITESEVV